MLKYKDKVNKFIELFDEKSGFYVRTGVIENGEDTGKDPFKRDFPQLIDIGVMGSCKHGRLGLCAEAGVECYQNGKHKSCPNMSVGDFKSIIDQCKGKVFQTALGGRGDVDQHECYEELLRICRENRIVPNFTTSGLGMTSGIAETCKKYVGAVAVSWYHSKYTLDAISVLLGAEVKTNIHYVLGNNSIDEAIYRLHKGDFPSGINAVIFLMHKPVGLGSEGNVLQYGDPRVKEFFELADTKTHSFKIGFDSCSCPGLINFTNSVSAYLVDYCEGGRFSCYIDAQMNMTPCSFAQDKEWQVDLRRMSIADAWDSTTFERFRGKLANACPNCEKRELCGGGCPVVKQITLCEEKEHGQQKSR